jgi:hypothetical protein
MRQVLILILLLIFPVYGFTQNGGNFKPTRITETQWNQHLKNARSDSNAHIKQGNDHILIGFNSDQRREALFFTTKNNPAHPAIIKVETHVNSSGRTEARVFGDYAGSRAKFDVWYSWILSNVLKIAHE